MTRVATPPDSTSRAPGDQPAAGQAPAAAPPRELDWVENLVVVWLAINGLWSFAEARLSATEPGVDWWAAAFTAVLGFISLAIIRPFFRFSAWAFAFALALMLFAGIDEVRVLVRRPDEWWRYVHLFFLGFLSLKLWAREDEFKAPDEQDAAGGAVPRAPAAQTPSGTAAVQEPPGAAATRMIREIQSLIVQAGSVAAVPLAAVREAASRNGLRLADLRPQALVLYRDHLEHYAADGALSPAERGELDALARLLELKAASVARLHAALEPPATPAPAPAAPSPVAPTPPADGLAADERAELDELARAFGVSPAPGVSPLLALDRLRGYKLTLTLPVPTVDASHPLEPGERCLEARTVELFRGPAGSPPAPAPADAPATALDPAALVDGTADRDRGTGGVASAGEFRLLLTDRRLLLANESGQAPLPLERIRRVVPYRDGLEVHPLRGDPVFLAFRGAPDALAMLVERARRDAMAG